MIRKRILLNAFTDLNLGDDLFLKILFDRFPETDFVLIADENKYKDVFRSKNIHFLKMPKTFIDIPIVRKFAIKTVFNLYVNFKYWINKNFIKNKSSQFDGTLTIGGSLFMQPKYKFQYKKNFHFLFEEIFKNKPKLIVGSNFGPYADDEFLKNYRTLFKNYHDVSFRDEYSHSLFSTLKNVRHHSDIVFALKTENIQTYKNTVGFSLIDLSGRSDLKEYTEVYENKILDLIENYCENNYQVYLFSFCRAEGDEKIINRLYDRLSQNYRSKIFKRFYNGDLDSFVSLFQNMEIMFATRFHAMILSLNSKQNMIPIIYSKKMRNVLDDIGFKREYIEIEKIGEFDFLTNSKGFNHYDLPDNIAKDAEKHFEKLDSFLKH